MQIWKKTAQKEAASSLGPQWLYEAAESPVIPELDRDKRHRVSSFTGCAVRLSGL